MRKVVWCVSGLLVAMLICGGAFAQEDSYPFEGKWNASITLERWFGDADVWAYGITLAYFLSPNFDLALTFTDWESDGAAWSLKVRYWFLGEYEWERPNPVYYIGAEAGRTNNLPDNATTWGLHVGADWMLTEKTSLFGELAWKHIGGNLDWDVWALIGGVRINF